ncbi:6,7-dimethyl-8-ribityllumazine synthase [Pediococcus argentinicus]|uniref:6,7-dimethyl-8-ribityllumazine synthase n=1 Tax=Pediococcus argentinicus TaxID=480391 RepID=A0A0R2NGH0_9LACO|nr:6,7-dimethyl-8-ribityllumazine synthase [Pediococcus argentinicus]KRO24888.1 riboflavin synthase subunit beta [Pediococcus argentinicus]NKZ22585.1 6,7-dimethyl-8-ribityllumazine synthase [Pediococcus argentinicus]GEP19754.1 6,7-dimethyl-8-ribityllumazine synthase [Pediococcus argentinicus]
MQEIKGSFNGNNLKIGIAIARFNSTVTSKLLDGAVDTLVRHGVNEDEIQTVWVSGAFEIPTVAKIMAESGKYDGLITLGAVIRGETSHYDLVCKAVADGVAKIGIETGIPTLFGVVTTDTVDQAMDRAGLKSGNKGSECAMDVIEMINLKKSLV